MTDDGQQQPRATWSLGKAANILGLIIGLLFGAGVFILALAVAVPILSPYLQWLRTETYGQIYVESPEVYTRERLVNDRYTQDYWLRQQLNQLDESTNLIDVRRWRRLQTAIGAKPNSDAGPDRTGGGEDFDPSFATSFEIRAAARDRIRQMILENLLDDRHDLTGNSVYGLKFDSTIIPGNNTHARPFVKVHLPLDSSLKKDDLAAFLEYDIQEINYNKDNQFHSIPQLFEDWRASIESRLTNYFTFASKGCENRYFQQNEVILDIISKVLAANKGEIIPKYVINKDEEAYNINLPEPWSRFFFLRVDRSVCPARITTAKLHNTYYLVRAKDWDAIKTHSGLRDGTPINLGSGSFYRNFIEVHRVPIPKGETSLDGVLGEGTPSGIVLTAQSFLSSKEALPNIRDVVLSNEPKASLGPKEIGALLRNKSTITQCFNPSTESDSGKGGYSLGEAKSEGGCADGAVPVKQVFVDWSLANFVHALSKFDAYAYAAFPRRDVSGVLSQYTQEAAIESVDGGYVPAASVNVAEGGRAARAVPSLVGFADGRSEGDAIDFGWVIAGTELTDPVQKSQLVLVSVPGFLDELELTITTGWLDGDANEVRVNPPFPVTVRLPPDFEVFDTLAGQGGIRPGPAIFDHYVDQSITVRACAQAEIVVPGARLWRSTSVTLGGQAANKITVLPNMQGIIATFTDLKPPSIFAEEPDPEIEQATQPSDDENRVYTTNLTVWTSEGTASLNRNVRVAVPKSGRCEIGTASPEAGPTVPVIAETQAAPSP